MQKLSSFSPIINQTCRTLILGSMPGVESLNAGEYYAHPRNQFWLIMTEIFNQSVSSYSEKKQMLLSHGFALWDVVGSCNRQGSLDSNIRDIEPNDIQGLFNTYTQLKRVLCNGKTSYKLFCKYFYDIPCEVTALPSTSPAYTISFQKKKMLWSAAIKADFR